MARLDMYLVSKIIKNELLSDITKDGFLSINIPKDSVKYYSSYIYYENICFYINNRLSETLYTIYYAYNTSYNSDISLKQIEDNTLSIKQLVSLLKKIYPNEYNNSLLELNTSSFIINIK
jgi:hypothetical protein